MATPLTAQDFEVLATYANNGQRELYWQYLAIKGDPYAQRALEVVRNDTYFGQIANKYAASYIPTNRQAEFTEAKWDDFGKDLVRKDFAARSDLFRDGDANGGLFLSVKTIRDYHALNFNEYGLSPNAWSLEKVLGPLIDSGQAALAQEIWNNAIGDFGGFLTATAQSVGQAVANGQFAWAAEILNVAGQYDPSTAFRNPNFIQLNGQLWTFDPSTNGWTSTAEKEKRCQEKRCQEPFPVEEKRCQEPFPVAA